MRTPEEQIKGAGIAPGYLPVLQLAWQLAQQGGLLAIDGRCASGKSTLARQIGEWLGCPVFHLDDYFLPAELRTPQRFAQCGGNVHYERFEAEVLRPFAAGQPVTVRAFDCHAMALKPPVQLAAAGFGVAEGCYAMHPALRGYYAGSVFFTHDADTQRARLLRRAGPEGLARFEERWIPLEERYFEGCGVQQLCSLTVDTSSLF